MAGPIPPTQWQIRHEDGRGLRRHRGGGRQLVGRSVNALRRGTEAARLPQLGVRTDADETCTLVIRLLDQDAQGPGSSHWFPEHARSVTTWMVPRC